MQERLSVWEAEGGALNDAPHEVMTGTFNQIAWARQIKTQVNTEFERVRLLLEAAAARHSGQDQADTKLMITILCEKRAEVMAHEQSGYFIREWQELRDQVRQMILRDNRYKAILAAKAKKRELKVELGAVR